MKSLSLVVMMSAFCVVGCATQTGVAGLSSSQGNEIIANLRDIKQLLSEQQKAPEKALDPDRKVVVKAQDFANISLGVPNAPVTVFEFTDYQCPFCKKFHDETFPALKAQYIDTGKVRYVIRDLPLNFHDQSMPAALATRCAGAQGKFWPVFNGIFMAPSISKDLSREVALQAGVNLALFDICLANPATIKMIEADIAEAEQLGVNGTPGFIIAERDEAGFSGTQVSGAQPIGAFATKIDALLAAQAKHP